MEKLKKHRRGLIEGAVAIAIFIVLAVVSALYDLAINKAMYNPNSLFGLFFAKLGELPTYITPAIVGVILFWQDFNRGKKVDIVVKVIAAIVIFAGFLIPFKIWFWDNFMAEDIKYSIIYQIFFSALLTALSILATAKVSKKTMRKLLILALFMLIIMAVSNIIVQVMKMIWARQRFRTMTPDNPINAQLLAIYGSNFEGFAPWYKPQLLFKSPVRTEAYYNAFYAVDSDAFKSFPSGHTVAAAASFGIIILPEMYEKLASKRWLFWAIPIAYTTIVAISRIVTGAHYLSDVLFAGYIGFAVAAITRLIFIKCKLAPKDSLFVKQEVAPEAETATIA